MDNLENAKITKIANYSINIRNLDGEYIKSYIIMYEFAKNNIFEYWYCLQDSGTMHFAIGGEKPIHDKNIFKNYIEHDQIEMDL